MAKRDFYNTDAYIKSIYQQKALTEEAKPIIDTYFKQIRAKLKPTVQDLPENADESLIRSYLVNYLSPLLKSQTSSFIEYLDKNNDLMSFYKFHKAFLSQLKNVKNLDSKYLITLWNKYKDKMLIYFEQANAPTATSMTAGEYEKLIKRPYKPVSQYQSEFKESGLMGNEDVDIIHHKKHGALTKLQTQRPSPLEGDFERHEDNPRYEEKIPYYDVEMEMEGLLNKLPYGYRATATKTPTGHRTYHKTARLGPAFTSIALEPKQKRQEKNIERRQHKGSGIIGVPYVARR